MALGRDGRLPANDVQSVFADEKTDREFAERGYVVRPLLAPDQIHAMERLHALLAEARSDLDS